METKEETFKCESCNRIFGSKEALEMHGAAKHPEKVPKDKKRFPVKKTRNWVIFILILGLVIFGVYFLMTSSNSFDDLPASEINIGSHKNIALHIHSDLEIKINNQWIILDCSNDSKLPSYNVWDGKSNCEIAVKFTKISSPEEALSITIIS